MKPHEAKRDHYRRLAKEQGYRSRSAYKLKQLNKAYRIIGPGFVVLDLGCAPGGWLQVAVQAAGNRGKVIGVDISYVEEIHGTEILRADIENDGIHENPLHYAQRHYSLAISVLHDLLTSCLLLAVRDRILLH